MLGTNEEILKAGTHVETEKDGHHKETRKFGPTLILRDLNGLMLKFSNLEQIERHFCQSGPTQYVYIDHWRLGNHCSVGNL